MNLQSAWIRITALKTKFVTTKVSTRLGTPTKNARQRPRDLLMQSGANVKTTRCIPTPLTSSQATLNSSRLPSDPSFLA